MADTGAAAHIAGHPHVSPKAGELSPMQDVPCAYEQWGPIVIVNCTKEAAAKVQLPLLFADDFRFNLLKADPSAFLSFGLTSQEAPQSSLLLRQRLERRSKRPSLSLTIRSLEPESREEEAH